MFVSWCCRYLLLLCLRVVGWLMVVLLFVAFAVDCCVVGLWIAWWFVFVLVLPGFRCFVVVGGGCSV